jgi:hypothetical protein
MQPTTPSPSTINAQDSGSGTALAKSTLTLSRPIYSTPAAPVSVIAVFAEVAVKSIENGVQVEAVLVVETVNVLLVPPAEARIETGGPPHLWV